MGVAVSWGWRWGILGLSTPIFIRMIHGTKDVRVSRNNDRIQPALHISEHSTYQWVSHRTLNKSYVVGKEERTMNK